MELEEEAKEVGQNLFIFNFFFQTARKMPGNARKNERLGRVSGRRR